MTDEKVAVILGVGPGLGTSLAQRFARESYAVGLMARSHENLRLVEETIRERGGRALSVPLDASDPTSVAAGFAQVRANFGAPEVFIYNAGAFAPGGILEITPEAFENSWRINCYGAFLGAREVLPAMLKQKRGTILFTGAPVSLHGSDQLPALAVGKFGLRALAQSLAREFGAQGIHVAHVVVHGAIETARTRGAFPQLEQHQMLSPEAIADVYWQLHLQSQRAWSLEIDLRPAVDPF